MNSSFAGICHLSPRRWVDADALRGQLDALSPRGFARVKPTFAGPLGLGVEGPTAMPPRGPAWSPDGMVWGVLDGHLLNAAALAGGGSPGHGKRPAQALDALVQSFSAKGLDALRRLEGSFSLALWDTRDNGLVLARDGTGARPLYYAQADDAVIFSSDLRGVLAHPAVSREIDPRALDEFLTFGFVAAPRTLFARVRHVAAGHFLLIRGGAMEERRFIANRPTPHLHDEEEIYQRLALSLRNAVARQLAAAPGLGVLLSGGLDSSILVGLAAGLAAKPVPTYSIGFEGDPQNETVHARQVARCFGTRHEAVVARPDPAAWLAHFPVHAEPAGDPSVLPLWLLSRAAGVSAPAVMSGDGGDELFGGHDVYGADWLDGWLNGSVPAPLRRLVLSLLERLAQAEETPRWAADRWRIWSAGREKPADLRHFRWCMALDESARRALYAPGFAVALPPDNAVLSLRDAFSQTAFLPDAVNRALAVDLAVTLPDGVLARLHMATRAHNLDARFPYLDHRVSSLALAIPGALKVRPFERKLVLKKAFARLLPPEILQRQKRSLKIPLDAWLRGPWREPLRAALLEGALARDGRFEKQGLERLLREHAAGVQGHALLLWRLWQVSRWQEKWLSLPASRRVSS